MSNPKFKIKQDGPSYDTSGKYAVEMCNGCMHLITHRASFRCSKLNDKPLLESRRDPDQASGRIVFPAITCAYAAPMRRPRTRYMVLHTVWNVNSGWEELFPEENYWAFRKKDWLMYYYFDGRGIQFRRMKKARK